MTAIATLRSRTVELPANDSRPPSALESTQALPKFPVRQKEQGAATDANGIPQLSWLNAQLGGLEGQDRTNILRLATSAVSKLEMGRLPAPAALAKLENPSDLSSAVLNRNERNALKLFSVGLKTKAGSFPLDPKSFAVTTKEELRRERPSTDRMTSHFVMGAAMGAAEAINRGEQAQAVSEQYREEVKAALKPTNKERMLNGFKSLGKALGSVAQTIAQIAKNSIEAVVAKATELGSAAVESLGSTVGTLTGTLTRVAERSVEAVVAKATELKLATSFSLLRADRAELESRPAAKPLVQTVSAEDLSRERLSLNREFHELRGPSVASEGPVAKVGIATSSTAEESVDILSGTPTAVVSSTLDSVPARPPIAIFKDQALSHAPPSYAEFVTQVLDNLIDGTDEIPNLTKRAAVQDILVEELVSIENGKRLNRAKVFNTIDPFLGSRENGAVPISNNYCMQVPDGRSYFTAQTVCNLLEVFDEIVNGPASPIRFRAVRSQ